MLKLALVEDLMVYVRCLSALVLLLGLTGLPLRSETPALGTVMLAQKSYIGAANASAGSTVFDGDKLSTESTGVIQIFTKAARLQLVRSGAAQLSDTQGIPTATLLRGVAVFSTANAKAFLLRASIAEIRAGSDAPTVGQVWMVSPKELRVQSMRGTLAVTVDGVTKLVPEATAYRVMLDPEAPPPEPPQEAEGAGTKKKKKAVYVPGRSRVIYTVAVGIGAVTVFAVHEAVESPDKP